MQSQCLNRATMPFLQHWIINYFAICLWRFIYVNRILKTLLFLICSSPCISAVFQFNLPTYFAVKVLQCIYITIQWHCWKWLKNYITSLKVNTAAPWSHSGPMEYNLEPDNLPMEAMCCYPTKSKHYNKVICLWFWEHQFNNHQVSDTYLLFLTTIFVYFNNTNRAKCVTEKCVWESLRNITM